MSNNRNLPPQSNTDTSDQDVDQQGDGDASARDPNAPNTAKAAPLDDTTTNPVIINK